jgi:putative hemolysin
MKTEKESPFSLELLFPGKKNRIERVLYAALENVLKVTQINQIYRAASDAGSPKEFCEQAAAGLGLAYYISAGDITKIPKTGPLIVVCNHPTGLAEGLGLLKILLSLRSDVKILAYDYLKGLSALGDTVIQVPSDPSSASQRAITTRAVRASLKYLQNAGALVVFPSGAVSHFNFRSFRIEDPPWQPLPIWLARKAACPILPTYFVGRNSLVFQIAGLVHPLARTLLLGRELLKKRHIKHEIRVGDPMTLGSEFDLQDTESGISLLRQVVQELGDRQS